MEIEAKKCVHTEHCCVIHGCKYGEDDICPVVQRTKDQSYCCESCGWFIPVEDWKGMVVPTKEWGRGNPIKEQNGIKFTVGDGLDTQVIIEPISGQEFRISIQETSFDIDRQQIAELGWLFIALAESQYDSDSVTELLDGYGLRIPEEFL